MRLGTWIALALSVAALAGARPSRAAQSFAEFELDRVELVGVTVFNEQEIEPSLTIGAGDRLNRARVLQSAENIRTLYRIHGYEQAVVHSKFIHRKNEEGQFESVLEFSVVEGKPVRVAALVFVPDGYRDESFQRFWRGLQPDLAAKSGLAIGDVFDQEQVTTAKRGLSDLLSSDEFIGAKVDDVRVITSEPPAAAAPIQKGNVARWVSVEFHLALGDRVSFGFRGNTVFTLGKLSGFVDDQRQLGFGKDYVTAIRNRIEDEYRAQGYARVRIVPYSYEAPETRERHVTYVIDEGPRATVRSLKFDGNMAYTNAELSSQFYARAPDIIKSGYYSERELQKSAELLIEWMKSQGYLAAKLVTINTTFSDRPEVKTRGLSVQAVIYIYEGEQTVVGNVAFDGMKALSREEAERILAVRPGVPLNLFAFSEGLEVFKAAYRAKGYLGIRILNEGTEQLVRYSQQNRVADVALEIAEGPQYRVGRIQIDGLSHTKEKVVRRELRFKEGEILEEPKVTQTEAALHRLGIFSQVSIRMVDDPDRPDFKNIRVSVEEGTPGLVAGGVGFRNDLGFRLFGQTGYTDLWGENHALTLSAAANRRLENFHFIEYQAQLAYVWPWVFLGNTVFRPSLTTDGTQYYNFDARTTTVAGTLERKLFSNPNVSAALTYSLQHVLQFNAPSAGFTIGNQSFTDNQTLTIGSITPTLTFDTRDSPLSPTTGWFASASFEYADPALGSDSNVGYTRTQVRLDRFIRLTPDIVWYLSARAGFERNDEINGYIPLVKQFVLGGAESLRGWDEGSVNLQNTFIVGTSSYVNYRTQVDLPFIGQLRFGPFIDAANLLVDTSFPTNDNLRFGAGAGLHYQTPVGPINLDWGFKLNRQPTDVDQDAYRFYFSIGII